jgi:hypothetical protein
VILHGFLAKSPDPSLGELFPHPEGKLAMWSFAMAVLFRI